MKHLKLISLSLIIIGLSLLSGCTKKVDTPATTNTSQNDQTGSTEADAGMSDANDYISNKIGGGSNYRVAAYNLPCGIIKVDSTITNGITTYNLHYGGQTPCGYKYKSGIISFALQSGTAFNQQNAVCAITFTNYVVTVQATGSTVTLNGTITDKNVSGGYLWQTVVDTITVVHQLRGALQITYANGQIRPLNYYQLRTWKSNGSWQGLSFSVAGDTTINGYTNVYQSGLTYTGSYNYYTQLTSPFTWSYCSAITSFVLETGEAKMNVTIPGVSNAYVDVAAGYYLNYSNLQSTPEPSNDCLTNAYKITEVFGTTTTTTYQLY